MLDAALFTAKTAAAHESVTHAAVAHPDNANGPLTDRLESVVRAVVGLNEMPSVHYSLATSHSPLPTA